MSSSSRLALCSVLLVLLGGTLTVSGQSGSASPFLPQDGSNAIGPATSGTHELVGMISSNKQTLVGITNKTTRKSVWIPVGKAVEGIEVISCDPKQDRAVVSINGQLETLVMHAGGPSGVAASVTPVNAPAPIVAGTKAEQEREARMLVSDLMEIGIQQRKAYEAAQKAGGQRTVNSPAAAQPAAPITPK